MNSIPPYVVSAIRSELESIYRIEGIMAILLFGSQVSGAATQESDYDICVVAPHHQSASEKSDLLGRIWRRVNANKYDTWLFEELPLYVQIGIIESHEILFCDDVPKLHEYFYEFRRHWRSQSHRQALSYEEG